MKNDKGMYFIGDDFWIQPLDQDQPPVTECSTTQKQTSHSRMVSLDLHQKNNMLVQHKGKDFIDDSCRVDTNEEDLAETPCRINIQTKRDEYASLHNKVQLEIQNLMKDSFIHQRDSFLDAKDFVINDEYRASLGGRNELMDKYGTVDNNKASVNMRFLSPSSSN